MLRKCKKLLAFLLALALVFTTFSSDYASAKVYAEEDAGQSDNSEGNDSEEENDEEESEDEEEEESDEESEDEDDEDADDDEESDEESEEESEEDAESEEIPEEEIPEEEIPEESEEESEGSEEGLIVVTYVAKDGGSVSNTKETFDPESEEEIILEGSTATADEGYRFTGWTLGDEKISSEATYVPSVADITENVEFTANFEEVEEEELAPVKDSVSVNGIKIYLHANPGVLPEDAVLDVKTLAESDEVTISEEDVKEAVDAVTEENVTATYSFDINIYSEEAGGYVQPEDGSVRITFEVESDEISSAIADEDTEVAVYYIAEEGGGIEGVDKVADIAENADITINTDHFSVYSVVLKNGNVSNDNQMGFTIKFRDYDNHSTKLKAEDSVIAETFTIGNNHLTPKDLAKQLGEERIVYNGQLYEFETAVDGGSNARTIDYFYVARDTNGKYRNAYKVKNGSSYYLDNGDVYFYYKKVAECSKRIVIAIRKDGVAPSEPNIYGGGDYTFIGPGEAGGTEVADLASYISMSSLTDTEVAVDATYGGKQYKVYAVAGIESVAAKLTNKFLTQATQYAKDYHMLTDGQYIDWYVIKYQTNDNMWHIDGVVRSGAKLNLNYDKNVPAGEPYSGLWPDSKQYTADRTGYASATVEGKNAVERDGKNKFISRPGYTFLGWSTDKEATTAQYVEGNTIRFNKNTTLYAVWKRNEVPVKLTYKYADGETADYVVNNLKSYNVVSIIANPSRQGYEFKGWKSDITGDTKVYGQSTGQTKSITMPEKNVVLTAQWDAVQVDYKVYWLERGTDKTLRAMATRQAKTGTTAVANQTGDKTIEGYTYDTTSVDNVVVTGNGKAEIKLYFIANKHSIKYQLKPNTPVPAGYTVPATENDVKFGTDKSVARKPNIEGYTFAGWTTNDVTVDSDGNFKMPDKDVTFTGEFTANNVDYKVYWLERGTNKTLRDMATRQAKTGTTAVANQTGDKTITGYTYDTTSVDSVVVTGNGKAEIKLYFTAHTHNIKYVLDPQSAKPKNYTVPSEEKDVKYDTAKTVAATPNIAGYDFEGWDTEDVTVGTDGTFSMPDKDVTFTGKFTALQANYKVSWWEIDGENIKALKNIDGNTGVEYVIRNDAVTGDIVNATDKDKKVTGYTFVRCDEDVEVVANTSNQMSEIKIYFQKASFKVYYTFEGNVPKDAKPYNVDDPSKPYAPQTYKYQESVNLATVAPVTIPAGYDFDGWRVAQNSLVLQEGTDKPGTFPMPANDVYLVGEFTAQGNIPYQIRYMLQNVNDDDYTEDKTERIETTGTTDDIVEGYVKDFIGFTHTEDKVDGEVVTSTIKIKGDGTLIVYVYYDRNVHDVTYIYDLTVYDPDDETPVDPSIHNKTSVRFGALVPVAADSSATGYSFDGWKYQTWKEIDETYQDAEVGPFAKLISYLTGAKAQQKYFEMPDGNVTLIGSFTPNKYTVKYEYDKIPEGMTDIPDLPFDGEEVEHDFGTLVSIADAVEAPDGYYFLGWKTPENVPVEDGQFKMPAQNIVIKGSFAEKLKIRISLAAPGDNADRLYNGQVQNPNVQIKFEVEGGDDEALAAYIEDTLNSAGDDILEAFNSLRGMFVITAYAYDPSVDVNGGDLVPPANDEIPEGIEVTGYTVSGRAAIDANKDREGTAEEDKNLVGREKDYPIVFNGSEMTITKDGVDLKNVADITVVDADGNEVTDLSGEITIGYLTIIPRQVTLTSGNGSKVSDGNPLTKPEVAISGDGFVAAVDAEGNEGAEIDVENLEANGAIGTITAPGSVANTIDDLEKFKTDFWRADTNYVITEVLGTLTVTSAGGGGDDTPDNPGTTTIPDAPVALAPSPAVLGAQRDIPVDGPAVLGARRAGTDDSTNRTARAFIILVSAAVALSLVIAGKKKRENEEE